MRKTTFEIEGDFDDFNLCHCGRCRKDTGSAHAANLFSSTAKSRWLSGQEKSKTFYFRGEGHIKSFCINCESALPNIQMDAEFLVVTSGSIDSDLNIKPHGHIYYASKANGDAELETVPKFKEFQNG